MERLRTAKNVGAYARQSVTAVHHVATSGTRQRFVLYSPGRAGTTLLSELLDAHHSIHCDGEILAHPLRLPRLHVAGRAMRSTSSVYGFKLLTYHLSDVQRVADAASFLTWLHRRGYRLYYLRRRDPLRHALSNLSARAHGFHSWGANPEIAARRSITVDLDELDRWLHGIEEATAYDAAALRGLPHQTIVYEDDLRDPSAQQRTVARMCEDFSLAVENVSTSLVRTTAEGLVDLVENYDELARHLSGTPHERFLDPA